MKTKIKTKTTHHLNKINVGSWLDHALEPNLYIWCSHLHRVFFIVLFTLLSVVLLLIYVTSLSHRHTNTTHSLTHSLSQCEYIYICVCVRTASAPIQNCLLKFHAWSEVCLLWNRHGFLLHERGMSLKNVIALYIYAYSGNTNLSLPARCCNIHSLRAKGFWIYLFYFI